MGVETEVAAFYRTFPPPLFVPVHWDGPRYLDDMDGVENQAHGVMVVCAARPGEPRWLRVMTSLDDGSDRRRSRRWELLRDLGMASREAGRAPMPEEAVAAVGDLPWRSESLRVDGHWVSFAVVRTGPFWAAEAEVGDRVVRLLASHLATEDVSLVAIDDLEDLIRATHVNRPE